MRHLSYNCGMPRQSEIERGDNSLELFARLLDENSSRYETEARVLLQEGHLNKVFRGMNVQHFLREGGSGYVFLTDSAGAAEEIFFQSLSDDSEYCLKLLIDQIAQSEVDITLLTSS